MQSFLFRDTQWKDIRKYPWTMNSIKKIEKENKSPNGKTVPCEMEYGVI